MSKHKNQSWFKICIYNVRPSLILSQAKIIKLLIYAFVNSINPPMLSSEV